MELLPAILRRTVAAGFVVFTDGTFNLNIIGIRSSNPVANRFDDLLTVTYRDTSYAWVTYGYPCTLDPGSYWLEHPGKVEGTAIVCDGQQRDVFQIGSHKGQYKCLVQKRPIQVWRDKNKDAVLDWPPSGDGVAGWYGIQIHRASGRGPVDDVGKWSAGCPVVQHPDQFADFMSICHKAMAIWGNSFSLTILREDQV